MYLLDLEYFCYPNLKYTIIIMNIKHIFLSSVCALSALAASAVPAMPGLITMTQADGTEIEVQLVGDEYSHYYLSEDGYLLASEGGDFFYADVDASGMVVTSGFRATPAAMRPAEVSRWLAAVDRARQLERLSTMREAALSSRVLKSPARGVTDAAASTTSSSKALPGLFPGADFPAFGEQKALVILVNYSDVKMSTEDAHGYFSDLLNEPGFSRYGGTGSARDYFLECSGGRFSPEFDVYGPVELPHERAYYGGNNPLTGDDKNAHQMIIDACDILDGDVDFAQYDRNGDGYIDNVFVFYAGRGEASGGGDDTVWPHAWEIENGGAGTNVYDGVVLNRYACSNELVGARPDGVGTFVHEFSHVMGLPDLYTTNKGSAFTPGSWSVLDYGPYNNDGHTPPLYSAFERCALGWMTPRDISGPLSAELEEISTNTAGIIRTSSENEYFLLENRQQNGWDTYIPGHGMLIWHIHYVPSLWTNNAVNNTISHQYVDLEEADGILSASTRHGDAFPGTSGVTSFTNETTPSMRTWNGEKLDLPITDIAESQQGIITFNVAGGANPQFTPTEALEAEDVTHCSFRAVWKEQPGSRYAVTLVDAATGQIVEGCGKLLAGTDTSFVFDGLDPDRKYIYRVYTGNDWQWSEPSNSVEVTTAPMTLALRTVNALPASDITHTSFTASWEPLPEATDYLLTVYSLTSPEMEVADVDFTGKVIPSGWTASFAPTFSPNAIYSGDAIPALTFKKNGETFTSPVFSKPLALVKFWLLGTNTDASNNVTVSVLVGDVWEKVAECELSKKQGGARVTLDSFPEGAKAVRFEFVRGTSFGNLYIDDIHVECHEPIENVYVDGYKSRSVGTETSHTVDGLMPGTTYYYIVDATDGTLFAKTSGEIAVSLPASTGIAGITSDSAISVKAAGGVITVRGAHPGAAVTLTDLLGRTVASATAGSDGSATLPATPGLCIVKAGTAVAKVLVK